jgi:uncharacterized protein YkwD
VITLIFLLFPASVQADPSPSALADNVSKRASSGKALIIDPSLAQAAERHAREILEDPTLATRDRVEAALAREGLADAQILPFSGLGEDPEALAKALVEFADKSKHRGATHLGLAFARREDRRALVAILSRRLVTVAPLASSPRPEPMVVRGRVLPGVKVDAFLLGPCASRLCLESAVEPLAVAREQDLISVRVPLDRGKGRYTIELLAERDRGPEVAALWTFAVGVPAKDAAPAPRSTEKNDARELEALIRAARDERELAPLSRNRLLDRAAQKHAEVVCSTMVAAHVLQGRDPPARARREGYRGSVAENVAIAKSVRTAHENFLSSPSHRVNVFSPVTVDLGLGVAARSTTPPAVCVVELYGR